MHFTKNKKMRFSIVLLLIAVSVIGIANVIWTKQETEIDMSDQSFNNFSNNTVDKSDEYPFSRPQGRMPIFPFYPEHELSARPSFSQTNDWKIYKSLNYNFELKYPLDWHESDSYSQMSPQGNLVVLENAERNSSALFIVASPIKTSKDVLDWYLGYYKYVENPPSPPKEIMINGLKFYKEMNSGEACNTQYSVKNGEYLFRFTASTWCHEETVRKYEQILVNIINTVNFNN